MTDDELAGLLDAAADLAAAEYYLDHLDEARAHADQAFAVGRASGHGDLFLVAYGIVGNIRLAEGDIAGATAFFDAAVETTRLSDNAQLLAWSLVNRSLVAATAGDMERALGIAEESVEAGALRNVATAWSGFAYATGLFGTGEAARAEEVLVDSAGGEELPDLPGGIQARGLELLTRCRLADGRRDDAARAASAARACADRTTLPLATQWPASPKPSSPRTRATSSPQPT